MSVSREDLITMAKLSIDGEFGVHSIDPFVNTYPELSEEEAYDGQEIRIGMLEEQGYKVVGYKLGGTSLAKMQQLKSTIYASGDVVTKTSTVVYGRLMDYMRIGQTDNLIMAERLHPKVEPEIAFVMGKDLCGAAVTAGDVMAATEYVAPAFEIIDSRFHNFKIARRFDAVIDDTSSARFKLGEGRQDPRRFDLANMGMKIALNGAYVGFGAGASVMGHPARAVADLVCALAKRGYGLKAGDVILSGAISPSTPVKLGDRVRADFGGLGFVEMEMV